MPRKLYGFICVRSCFAHHCCLHGRAVSWALRFVPAQLLRACGMSDRASARAWALDGHLPELVSFLTCLYLVNLALHAVLFPCRNPHVRPKAQSVVLTACRVVFSVPVNIALGCWLVFWILFWEIARRPLWKPKFAQRIGDGEASVAMCGGGFRTWYHLGVYWGLFDKLGKEGLRNVKFSGASIGALVATVAGTYCVSQIPTLYTAPL